MQIGVSGSSETTMSDEPQLPQFSATLLPHRSLSRKGFIALMLFSGAINSVLSVAFALRGAWPVAGFCGLALGLLYLAFHLNYKAARMSETIVLRGPELRVTRKVPQGRRKAGASTPIG